MLCKVNQFHNVADAINYWLNNIFFIDWFMDMSKTENIVPSRLFPGTVYRLLSRPEEAELIRCCYADTTASAAAKLKAQQTLILAYQPVLESLALRFASAQSRNAVDRIDLAKDYFGEGMEGFIHAAHKYDASKNVPFIAYAKGCALAKMMDYQYRTWPTLSVPQSADFKKALRYLRKFRNEKKLEPHKHLSEKDVAFIAIKLCVTEQTVSNADYLICAQHISLDAPVPGTDNLSLHNVIPSDEPRIDDSLAEQGDQDRKLAIIQVAMGMLTPREQDIISYRFIQDPRLTLDQIAVQLGISRERVRQVEARAMQKIKSISLEMLDGKLPTATTEKPKSITARRPVFQEQQAAGVISVDGNCVPVFG